MTPKLASHSTTTTTHESELMATSTICKNADYDVESILNNSLMFRFEDDDDFKPRGLEGMINKSSKWFVAALTIGLILWRHDAQSMWAVLGCVMNAWLSLTLKHIIKQERPYPKVKSGPGMPSSHAQFIFFAFIFVVRTMVKFKGINQVTCSYIVLALVHGSYLSWLRISQRFHTITQVVAGAVVGTVFSSLWFQAWDAFIFHAFVQFFWVRILVVFGSIASCLGYLGRVRRK